MTRKEEIVQAAIDCCGAEKEWQPDRMIFIMGAEWADKTMIEKACEWLLNHNDYQRVLDNGNGVRFDMTQCVTDFRKAMEE